MTAHKKTAAQRTKMRGGFYNGWGTFHPSYRQSDWVDFNTFDEGGGNVDEGARKNRHAIIGARDGFNGEPSQYVIDCRRVDYKALTRTREGGFLRIENPAALFRTVSAGKVGSGMPL
jgi:hypothetical protein